MCVRNKQKEVRSGSNRIVLRKQFLNLKALESCECDNDLRDVLSISTHYTKEVFNYVDNRLTSVQNSPVYKILFKTSQPAHFATALAIVILGFVFYPSSIYVPAATRIVNLIYLGSFSTYFGSQIWMSFVSGLSLYFSLPRHHFGEVQRVLFPKYFTFNSLLSFLTLWSFIKIHRSEILDTEISVQMLALLASFSVNLLVRLYLTPPLLSFMRMKNAIEKKAGVGMEVGHYDIGELKNCPHYVHVHKSFRRVHMLIAFGNILTMACTAAHLFHLSGQLCVA